MGQPHPGRPKWIQLPEMMRQHIMLAMRYNFLSLNEVLAHTGAGERGKSAGSALGKLPECTRPDPVSKAV